MSSKLPLKVLNRLRLGRRVAARVPPSRAGQVAWVRVQPLLSPGATWDNPNSTERRAVAPPGIEPIRGFEVRRVELPDEVVADIWEAPRLEPSVDQRVLVANEQELEGVLSRWLSDFGQLRVPSLVGYHRLD